MIGIAVVGGLLALSAIILDWALERQRWRQDARRRLTQQTAFWETQRRARGLEDRMRAHAALAASRTRLEAEWRVDWEDTRRALRALNRTGPYQPPARARADAGTRARPPCGNDEAYEGDTVRLG